MARSKKRFSIATLAALVLVLSLSTLIVDRAVATQQADEANVSNILLRAASGQDLSAWRFQTPIVDLKWAGSGNVTATVQVLAIPPPGPIKDGKETPRMTLTIPGDASKFQGIVSNDKVVAVQPGDIGDITQIAEPSIAPLSRDAFKPREVGGRVQLALDATASLFWYRPANDTEERLAAVYYYARFTFKLNPIQSSGLGRSRYAITFTGRATKGVYESPAQGALAVGESVAPTVSVQLCRCTAMSEVMPAGSRSESRLWYHWDNIAWDTPEFEVSFVQRQPLATLVVLARWLAVIAATLLVERAFETLLRSRTRQTR